MAFKSFRLSNNHFLEDHRNPNHWAPQLTTCEIGFKRVNKVETFMIDTVVRFDHWKGNNCGGFWVSRIVVLSLGGPSKKR